MAQKDYYKILGVAKDASDKDLKSAFRRLARKYHPDVNPGDKSAEEKFKEVSVAYDVLSDPKKRKLFDQFGDAAFGQGAPSPGEGRGYRWTGAGPFGSGSGGGIPNLGDLFSDLFGSRTGHGDTQIFDDAAPGEGQDIVQKLDITLRDTVLGRTMEFTLKKPVLCRACSGAGYKSSSIKTCPECGGTGQKHVSRGRGRIVLPCRSCGGAGRLAGEACDICAGSGNIEGTEHLVVKIPAGVDTGSKVRVAGKGYPGAHGGPPGDLFLDINVLPDHTFKREGLDLRTDIDIPFHLAILGGKVDVAAIDGMVKLTIPPNTRGGQIFRLSGKGVPKLGSKSTRGDLFARANITIPKNLSKKARELLDEFAREAG